MAWLIRLPDGGQVSSDDFTLDDLMEIEEATGEPWSVSNPLRHAKTARAFLKAAYRRNGLAEGDVDSLTLGVLKSVFDFREDKPFPGDGEADEAPLDRKGSASSRGASGGSTGSRRKPGDSA